MDENKRAWFGKWLLTVAENNFLLAFRPKGMKFDENDATLLMYLTECSWGLRVGDSVKFKGGGPDYYLLEGKITPSNNSTTGKFIIIGFVQLFCKRKSYVIKDIFCVLGKETPPDKPHESCHGIDPDNSGYIKTLLFWPGCLEKIKDKE